MNTLRIRLGIGAIILVLFGGGRTLCAGNPANPILFVTQVPMPEEVNSRDVTVSYQSCVSPFSNHLADTAHAGRGGSLFVRFNDGQVVDLLAVADWSAIPGGKPAANIVAVRNPSVNWTADKALFSMVVGAPSSPTDTITFTWQLYEITLLSQVQLNANVKPVLTKLANQPAFNNVFPCYASNGKILFASDRPYNGQAHLTQREEYLGLPTVSGIWSLDPSSANSLRLLHHSPSGGFTPIVDSYGRVIFTNWDHLSRDSEAVTDSRNGVTGAPYNETFTQTFNGSGNFTDESAAAAFTQVATMAPNSWEIFPEPRSFDHKTIIDFFGGNINGNAFNLFLPWMMNQDGTGIEIVNHVGRHEIAGTISKSFNNDGNIVDLNPGVNPGYGGLTTRNFFNNLMWTREDPLSPGTFYGSDAADLGTHGAGQIVRMNSAGAGQNPDGITVTYVTSGANGLLKPAFIPTARQSINSPPTGISPLTGPNAESLYRTPVPLADGNLVASHAANVTQTDYNSGTVAQPASLFTFRIKSLKASGQTFVPDVTLTTGININTSYYVGSTLVTYNGPAWELDPAEIAQKTEPAATTAAIAPVEAGVFNTVGVHLPTFQNYLVGQNAALTVSRDVTKRDRHDRQQPFNLKVAWSNTQTVGTAGKVYSVAWIQFLQADLRRGYLLGGNAPVAGRRVVATPMHDTIAQNVQTPGAPAGSLRLGDDGSFAAIVPAGKAMTWHLLDNDAALTSQVKERFWVTFQPGEVRTCANCHGINTADQAGSTSPTNPPQALTALLQFWKTSHPSGVVQFTQPAGNSAVALPALTAQVSRTGGSVGPVTVNYTTQNNTAIAGVDFTAPVNGQLNWADGDTAPKTISIPLINTQFSGQRVFTILLSNPQYGTLGGQTSFSATLTSAVNGNSSPSNVQTQISAASINENGSIQLTGLFADPDVQDTHSVSINWGDGSQNSIVQLVAGVFAFSTNHTYLNNPVGAPQGSFAIATTISDAQLSSVPSAASAQVKNVAPTVTIVGTPQNVIPNSVVSLTSTIVDPGTQDTFTYAWSVNKDGAPFASGSQSSFNFTPDAEATYVVSLTVTDSDGASGSASASVASVVTLQVVSGPTADPNPGYTGLPVTFSIVTQPTNALISWDFGDAAPLGAGANVTHDYNVAGIYNVTVSLVSASQSSTVGLSLEIQDVPENSNSALPGTELFGIQKGSISLSSNTNKISLMAAIPIAQGGTVPGNMVVGVNGVRRTFTLDAKGRSAVTGGSARMSFHSKKGTISAQNGKLKLLLTGSDIPTGLSATVTTDAEGLPKACISTLDYSGHKYSLLFPLHFKGKGKSARTATFGIHP